MKLKEYIMSNLESKDIQFQIIIFLIGQNFTLMLMNKIFPSLSLKVSEIQTLQNKLYYPAAPPILMFITPGFRV
jgi:hypothetical protein